jgi:hypothetical protein
MNAPMSMPDAGFVGMAKRELGNCFDGWRRRSVRETW